MKVRLVIIASVIVSSNLQAVTFSTGIDGEWHFVEQDTACTLIHTVQGYGEARFVASEGSGPTFELQARQDWHAPGDLSVTLLAPAWHLANPQTAGLGTTTHIEGGGALARGALAAQMLMALRDGYDLSLTGAAWFMRERQVDVRITATRFQPAFEAFKACAHTHVNVSWQQMSRTRITYETDEFELSEGALKRLQGLVRFVAQDPQITQVFVDGHTDNSGTKAGNYNLSKRRAETVARFLETAGVNAEVVVRFHGAAYPVADNASFDGKAANRRTTVRLERASQRRLAAAQSSP